MAKIIDSLLKESREKISKTKKNNKTYNKYLIKNCTSEKKVEWQIESTNWK